MIISASRRTDIPALYADWFMHRIRAGFCEVPNPFNPGQVSRIPLEPKDVDGIVFWTRNPTPMLGHLDELEQRGYRFYFLVTVLDYPRSIEPGSPAIDQAIRAFRRLAASVGRQRVVWRYDPVLFTGEITAGYHRTRFDRLAAELTGHTDEVKISLVDLYRKTRNRITCLAQSGVTVTDQTGVKPADLEDLLCFMSRTAQERGMSIASCAEEMDMAPFGIAPGKCIDDGRFQRVWGCELPSRKDPSQRKACGCAISKDIGMYDSCTLGCQYCYAVSSFEKARRNRVAHDPQAAALIGSRR